VRLPRWRKASREQVRKHDEAVRSLWAVPLGDCRSTPRYAGLDRRVRELRQPLSPVQRSLPATRLRVDRAVARERRGRSR
jgi:hypothetical protein